MMHTPISHCFVVIGCAVIEKTTGAPCMGKVEFQNRSNRRARGLPSIEVDSTGTPCRRDDGIRLCDNNCPHKVYGGQAAEAEAPRVSIANSKSGGEKSCTEEKPTPRF
jgi:hypothetical protein